MRAGCQIYKVLLAISTYEWDKKKMMIQTFQKLLNWMDDEPQVFRASSVNLGFSCL